jgi:hypothetical protein
VEGGRGRKRGRGKGEGLPMLEDCKFRGSVDPFVISPMLQRNGFQNMVTTLMPARLPRLREISKDPYVSLFPSMPEDESWKELPDPIEEGGLECVISPVCNGVNNTLSSSI